MTMLAPLLTSPRLPPRPQRPAGADPRSDAEARADRPVRGVDVTQGRRRSGRS